MYFQFSGCASFVFGVNSNVNKKIKKAANGLFLDSQEGFKYDPHGWLITSYLSSLPIAQHS